MPNFCDIVRASLTPSRSRLAIHLRPIADRATPKKFCSVSIMIDLIQQKALQSDAQIQIPLIFRDVRVAT